jgi:plastocyanin
VNARKHRLLTWSILPAAAALALALTACDLAPKQPPASEPATSAPAGEFSPTATVQDIMLAMVDPKADAIWNSVATVVTLEGTEEKRPQTEEDWIALRHDAITLVEATNLLLMMDRKVAKPGVKSENPGIELEPEDIQKRIEQDPETWKKMVHGLHDASVVMLEAVDARNVDMLFDNGGNLDAACETCHRQYWYPDPEHHAPPPSEAEKALRESADAGTNPAAGAWPIPGLGGGGTGTIEGHVKLAGKLPGNTVIRMGMDPKCADATRGKQVVQEEFALEADGSLANVFVQLAGKFPETAVPSAPVIVGQSDCVFTPRVVGARVGQLVQFKNDDPLLHNVHGMSATTNTFNIAQPMQGMVSDVRLAEEDGVLHVKCDVHRWMNAWIGVVEHPYFAVSDRAGAFVIRGVPAGEHTVVAWHEKLGSLEQKVGVEPGAIVPIELIYPEASL